MTLTERFVDADGIRLHVLVQDPAEPSGVPLVFVPGMADTADEYRDFLAALAPRPALAITMRGRGRSRAPDVAGFSAEDHAGDIAAVAAAVGWRRFALMTFSRGTTYGLAFVARWPERVAGLVIADYPAQQTGLPQQFPEAFAPMPWRGRPSSDRVGMATLEAIQRDSVETIPMWDVVADLDVPVMTLRGERSKMVSEDHIARYDEVVADHRHVTLPGRGHDLWEPDPGPLLEAVEGLLRQVDDREP